MIGQQKHCSIYVYACSNVLHAYGRKQNENYCRLLVYVTDKLQLM